LDLLWLTALEAAIAEARKESTLIQVLDDEKSVGGKEFLLFLFALPKEFLCASACHGWLLQLIAPNQ
jgi:hypothetical protein